MFIIYNHKLSWYFFIFLFSVEEENFPSQYMYILFSYTMLYYTKSAQFFFLVQFGN